MHIVQLNVAACAVAFVSPETFVTSTERIGRAGETVATLITAFISLIMNQSAVEAEQILNSNVAIFITLELKASIDSFVLLYLSE